MRPPEYKPLFSLVGVTKGDGPELRHRATWTCEPHSAGAIYPGPRPHPRPLQTFSVPWASTGARQEVGARCIKQVSKVYSRHSINAGLLLTRESSLRRSPAGSVEPALSVGSLFPESPA